VYDQHREAAVAARDRPGFASPTSPAVNTATVAAEASSAAALRKSGAASQHVPYVSQAEGSLAGTLHHTMRAYR
jgi:hypothetical protein